MHLTCRRIRALIEAIMKHWLNHAIGILKVWVCCVSLCAEPNALVQDAHLRYPVRMALIEQDTHLLVANGRSGSLSLIDLQQGRVLEEWHVTSRLSDMLWLPETASVYLLDDLENTLIHLVRQSSGAVVEQGRWSLPPNPSHLSLAENGQRLAISSIWSRQVTLVSLPHEGSQTHGFKTLDLSFNPGALSFIPGTEMLLITDAFGGLLAVMDHERELIHSVTELPMNNLGRPLLHVHKGEKSLWLAGQSLNPRATTFQTEVMWGVLMDNQVRSMPLEAILEPNKGPEWGMKVHGLGDETGPGGDPSTLRLTRSGKLIAALQGVDRIAIRPHPDRPDIQRISVGDRPVDMLMNEQETRLYVANQFSDSISVIDLETFQPLNVISLGPQPPPSQVDEGERLFYDASLSLRGWFSCHSCHPNGHTTGMLNDNLGDDHFGAPKRILSLLGVGETAPFAWRGLLTSLEAQIAKSLRDTMIHPGDTESMAQKMAAFLQTLQPPPSWHRLRNRLDDKEVERGRRVFHAQGCQECHRPPAFTTQELYDVGIHDEAGQSHFNPPSLRGLAQRDRFFHDNRATSLDSVFVEHGHPDAEAPRMVDEDRRSLIEFLNSL